MADHAADHPADPLGNPPVADGPWFAVSVTCTTAAAELVADVLWQAGTPAVEERAVEERAAEERAGKGPDLVILLAGFPDQAVADQAADRVAEIGGGAVRSVSVAPVLDDGSDAWREHATAIEAGPFTLVPTWVDHHPVPGRQMLLLDPGATFGSGSHPTTRLVLDALARLVEPGDVVLDVGCGSGVLAIAAALLGAEAVGIDVDPAAPEVTVANARRNRVDQFVRYDDRPLADLAEQARSEGRRYDVVVANLLSPIVVDLASDLVEVVEAGGHLVVSGLLVDRLQPMLDAVDGLGPHLAMSLVEQIEAEGWAALTFVRSAHARPDLAQPELAQPDLAQPDLAQQARRTRVTP